MGNEKFKLGQIVRHKGSQDFGIITKNITRFEKDNMVELSRIYDGDTKRFKSGYFTSFDNIIAATDEEIKDYEQHVKEAQEHYEKVRKTCIKPLDFVRPVGYTDIGIVKETSGVGGDCSVIWLENKGHKTAWWGQKELERVNSLPVMLCEAMAHPFGNNEYVGERFYGNLDFKFVS